MRPIRFVLKDDEQAALSKLAEHEKRRIEAQACLIIRRELERLGLLAPLMPLSSTNTPAPTELSSAGV